VVLKQKSKGKILALYLVEKTFTAAGRNFIGWYYE
jgi:hypothetical protein